MNIEMHRSFAYDVMKFDGDFSDIEKCIDRVPDTDINYYFTLIDGKKVLAGKGYYCSGDAIPIYSMEQLMDEISWSGKKVFTPFHLDFDNSGGSFEIEIYQHDVEIPIAYFESKSWIESLMEVVAWQKGFGWDNEQNRFVKRG